MAWTEERVERLKKLWAAGESSGRIAEKLGGVTRNAVIGKLTRLGLSRRTTPARKVRKRRRSKARPARQPESQGEPFPTEAVEPEPSRQFDFPIWEPLPADPQHAGPQARIGILDLRPGQCRWPLGDRDFHFCGRETVPGKPYCLQHCGIATTEPPPRGTPRSPGRRRRPNVI